MRYVLVRNNIVENVIEWSGGSEWSPPVGVIAIQSNVMCGIGWSWNNGAPVDPNPAPIFVPPTPIDLSNSDNLDRVLRAIALMTGRWAGKTPAQIKANFLTAYQDVG
jgi:hypothetical protein